MQSHQRYMADAQQLQLYVQSSRPSMSPHDSGISFMPSWREKTPDYALFGSASYRRHSLPSDLPHSEPFQASFPSTNYGHYNPNPNGQRAPPSNVDHYYRNHSYIQNVQNGIGAGSPTSASGGEYYAGRNAGGGSAIRNGHHSTNTNHSHRFHPSNTVGSYPPSNSSSSGVLNYQRQHRQSQMYPPPILDSSSISPRKKRVYLPKESTNILKNWLLAHCTNPYPTDQEKLTLAQQTGLTVHQINNWFINARRRILQPLLKQQKAQQKQQQEQKQQFQQGSPQKANFTPNIFDPTIPAPSAQSVEHNSARTSTSQLSSPSLSLPTPTDSFNYPPLSATSQRYDPFYPANLSKASDVDYRPSTSSDFNSKDLLSPSSEYSLGSPRYVSDVDSRSDARDYPGLTNLSCWDGPRHENGSVERPSAGYRTRPEEC